MIVIPIQELLNLTLCLDKFNKTIIFHAISTTQDDYCHGFVTKKFASGEANLITDNYSLITPPLPLTASPTHALPAISHPLEFLLSSHQPRSYLRPSRSYVARSAKTMTRSVDHEFLAEEQKRWLDGLTHPATGLITVDQGLRYAEAQLGIQLQVVVPWEQI